MILNADCIRDVLIVAEEKTGYQQEWLILSDRVEDLPVYTFQEAMYHIQQCIRSGLLKKGKEFIDGSFEIVDLTPEGHQALHALQHPKVRQVWKSKVSEAVLTSTVSGLVEWALGILKNLGG